MAEQCCIPFGYNSITSLHKRQTLDPVSVISSFNHFTRPHRKLFGDVNESIFYKLMYLFLFVYFICFVCLFSRQGFSVLAL